MFSSDFSLMCDNHAFNVSKSWKKAVTLTFYINTSHQQKKSYLTSEILSCCTSGTHNMRCIKIMAGQGFISKDMKQYLMPGNVRAGKVKGNWIMYKKRDYPMRLIIARNNHPAETMVIVAERELEEHVSNQPSYICDTPNFLFKVITKGAILFCIDIAKLYPSIPI